jgi:hypothetical protein
MRLLRLLLIVVLLLSCNQGFDRPRYLRDSPSGRTHRRLPIWKQGTYRDPLVKREARREKIAVRLFNLDEW